MTEFPVTAPTPWSMLTVCAPVIDQVSVVVPSLVILEGEAAKLAIVGAVAVTGGGGGGGEVPAGSLPPPQPSVIATAMTDRQSVLLMVPASVVGDHANRHVPFLPADRLAVQKKPACMIDWITRHTQFLSS